MSEPIAKSNSNGETKPLRMRSNRRRCHSRSSAASWASSTATSKSPSEQSTDARRQWGESSNRRAKWCA